MTTPAIDVNDLTIRVGGSGAEPVTVVRGVSFALEAGRRLGIVGESGSGKTMSVMALLGLLPASAQVEGSIRVDGVELVGMSEQGMRKIRGRKVAMIFQNPMSALNPTKRVGALLVQSIRHHFGVSKAEARERAVQLLEEVGIASARERLRAYPHEFSGGMKQRVCIALALSGDPQVLIADEATTALDVTTQARVMDLLLEIGERRGLATILVTHDLALASQFCTEIQVMYAGKIVERRPAAEFYAAAEHPYSRGLLNSHCDLALDINERIAAIGGQPPSLLDLPSGCAFHPRCPMVVAECSRREQALVPHRGGLLACSRLAPAGEVAGVGV